ncbi:MAG: 4Fe-4S dicluster domain-containing protein [Clostridiales Family XIII bacterium]|nr:4Fe-4S dicluster domain-containing protein [Clostridiales Family XIII bacterium]
MAKSKKSARVGLVCVACGSCEGVCPKKAIAVARGVRAVVSEEKCVGCGKCVEICPAGVITLSERSEAE